MLLYNEEFKRRFLWTIKDKKELYKTAEKMFEVAGEYETVLGKDLYQFAPDEIERVVKSYVHGVGLTAIKLTISALLQYFDYAKKNKKVKENPMIKYDYLSDYKHYLDETTIIASIITEEEYRYILNNLYNPIDACIIALIWEGLEFEELRNLKISDVDLEKNIIKLPDRILHMPDYLRELVSDAIEEDFYVRENGNGKKYRLAYTGYLVRTELRGNNLEPIINPNVLSLKIRRIGESVGYKNLSYQWLRKSSIINFVAKNGENWEKVKEKYGYTVKPEDIRYFITPYVKMLRGN
ncbi:MAG: hypothetical protein ACPLKS_06685 [Caldisericum exile]|uniref:phage lytic cycle repressor MrpR family protein n=1 Tax=Caldisericum exile TaxID=693075 RepID=UPI003C71FC84